MHRIETEMVQPGWEVWTTGGEKLGMVTRVEGASLAVRKEGLLGGETIVPRDAIRSVEERRIEVEVSAEGPASAS